MAITYLQIFSMTDHAKPLNGRFQGPYSGMNEDLQTSTVMDGALHISTATQAKEGEVDRNLFQRSNVIVAYRHSDTGVLQGTSEMLLPISKLPWTDMPGFEVINESPHGDLQLKLWEQEITIKPNRLSCVRLGNTIVYLKSFGRLQEIIWSDKKLEKGPTHLHAEQVDDDLSLAPPSGSGLQVKMGQETES